MSAALVSMSEYRWNLKKMALHRHGSKYDYFMYISGILDLDQAAKGMLLNRGLKNFQSGFGHKPSDRDHAPTSIIFAPLTA